MKVSIKDVVDAQDYRIMKKTQMWKGVYRY